MEYPGRKRDQPIARAACTAGLFAIVSLNVLEPMFVDAHNIDDAISERHHGVRRRIAVFSAWGRAGAREGQQLPDEGSTRWFVGLAERHAIVSFTTRPRDREVTHELITKQSWTGVRAVVQHADRGSTEMTTRRIAIVGNAGGGKSLLARDLGRALDIPVHSIDDVQWGPGWTRESPDVVRQLHDAWLAHDAWIIDGWGDWDLLSRRFAASDLVVFVDFPLRVHEQWALRRQAEVTLGLRHDWPPRGCSAAEITGRLLELMRQVDRDMLPRLRAMLADNSVASRFVRLRNPREFRAWRRAMLGARAVSE